MFSIIHINKEGDVSECDARTYKSAVDHAKFAYGLQRIVFVQVLNDETDRPVLTLGARPVDSITRAKWAAWGIVLVTALALTTLI